MAVILLASSSPRRRDLLLQIHWEPRIVKSSFQEVKTPEEAERRKAAMNHPLLSSFSGPDLVCALNALGKAEGAACGDGEGLPLLAADTIVTAGGKILGKPKDRGDASRMLHFLSGRSHEVKTGTALLYRGRALVTVTTTTVRFRKLTDQEIKDYIATGEPMDKAGAYGIQGLGTLLVDSIDGSYDNVVGLPLTVVYGMMKELAEYKGHGTVYNERRIEI
ncbi:nucleoside triphosphate pyrophosphatase [uncultured Dialister sp.]|jgi:septum formation protein|uniref:Maf family protein n=1 Tax=uncultured Dialister sp. TaxID=278064 RepID=UPI0025D06D97|nr:Maf family protein [uncultured Dialister sp.]